MEEVSGDRQFRRSNLRWASNNWEQYRLPLVHLVPPTSLLDMVSVPIRGLATPKSYGVRPDVTRPIEREEALCAIEPKRVDDLFADVRIGVVYYRVNEEVLACKSRCAWRLYHRIRNRLDVGAALGNAKGDRIRTVHLPVDYYRN